MAAASTVEEVTGEYETGAMGSSFKERQMRGLKNELEERPVRRPTGSAALGIFAPLLAGSVQLCEARTHSQTTFRSPEDASRALFLAVQTHDERAVTENSRSGDRTRQLW